MGSQIVLKRSSGFNMPSKVGGEVAHHFTYKQHEQRRLSKGHIWGRPKGMASLKHSDWEEQRGDVGLHARQ